MSKAVLVALAFFLGLIFFSLGYYFARASTSQKGVVIYERISFGSGMLSYTFLSMGLVVAFFIRRRK